MNRPIMARTAPSPPLNAESRRDQPSTANSQHSRDTKRRMVSTVTVTVRSNVNRINPLGLNPSTPAWKQYAVLRAVRTNQSGGQNSLCKHSTLHVFCCSDDDVDKQIQPASDTKIITYFSWTKEYIREFCNESLRHHRTALFRDTTY